MQRDFYLNGDTAEDRFQGLFQCCCGLHLPGRIYKVGAAGIPPAAAVLSRNYQIRVTTPAIAIVFAL
jgi:hypothetical protein